eukprot:CAMPEP_0203902112 /NCGR_PEP_ID=MMETSP0359-20131031/44187_1 /ASSEMBLY_ACC=CAM_ASM_000338 /TAXON_ID=268821 /ORGANISM="Scrippsiella Hangoei, Strain SHTV-5" /LENGTH=46 /DNA_ID= /DNA_START= /DNA_END= /DNA_ORIENTATION=
MKKQPHATGVNNGGRCIKLYPMLQILENTKQERKCSMSEEPIAQTA